MYVISSTAVGILLLLAILAAIAALWCAALLYRNITRRDLEMEYLKRRLEDREKGTSVTMEPLKVSMPDAVALAMSSDAHHRSSCAICRSCCDENEHY